jgi:hypothetical protein
MILTYNTPYYFSLGFGNTMANAKDLWVFNVNIEKYKLTNYTFLVNQFLPLIALVSITTGSPMMSNMVGKII